MITATEVAHAFVQALALGLSLGLIAQIGKAK